MLVELDSCFCSALSNCGNCDIPQRSQMGCTFLRSAVSQSLFVFIGWVHRPQLELFTCSIQGVVTLPMFYKLHLQQQRGSDPTMAALQLMHRAKH